jgi:hypothetical protein
LRKKVSPKKPKPSRQTDKTRTVLNEAKNSVQAFLGAFDKSCKSRRDTGGMSTDEEQDLLRAMLVFAAAGLDSVLKRLIKDSILDLSKIDDKVRARLESFISGQLRTDSTGTMSNRTAGFLAAILASPSAHTKLIELYIAYLTGTSLQSADEVARTISALGLEHKPLKFEIALFKKIFDVRNAIIHELDINLDSRSRRRNIRRRDEMREYSEALLRLADAIVEAVDNKLKRVAV